MSIESVIPPPTCADNISMNKMLPVIREDSLTSYSSSSCSAASTPTLAFAVNLKEEATTTTTTTNSDQLLPSNSKSNKINSCKEQTFENETYMIDLIGNSLQKMTSSKSKPIIPHFAPTFYLPRKAPSLSLPEYIRRIVFYLNQGRASDLKVMSMTGGLRSLIISLIYIDRSLLRTGHSFSTEAAHRLVLIAIIVATKYSEDFPLSALFMARVGGISIEELNILEIEFSMAIGFDFFITDIDFYRFCDQMKRCCCL